MTRPEPNWELLRASLSGELLLPGSTEYEWARKSFIARFDEIRPQAVACCAIPEDVREVVAFARRSGVEMAVRSGGHSLAGYSSTRGVVIDVSRMDSVVVGDGVVRVGAGTRTGELCERLFQHGLAIPTGTCPSVGIAGLTLGGGIGTLGRAYGLTLDRLLGAEVVLADGSVVECDEHQHPDLFWALRGAGAGNFGVVTSFGFEPLAAPEMANFHLLWRYGDAAAVIAGWQEWSPRGPDELSADLVLSAPGDPSLEPAVEIYGAVIGTKHDASDLLAQLTKRVGVAPHSHDCKELSYGATCAFQAEVSVGYDQIEEGAPKGRKLRQGYRFTKSQFFARPLPHEAIAALTETFESEREQGELRSIGFAPWGGAYNRREPQATAFPHRDQLFSIEHIVIVDPAASSAAKSHAYEWATRSWASVSVWAAPGVYPCFPDPELDDSNRAYYGDNTRRLQDVKTRYDPHGIFHFEQSLSTN